MAQDEIELVLQIGGKTRGSIRVPATASREQIEQIARSSPASARHVGDQAIRSLANRSRDGLLQRIRALLDEEADRYLRLIDAAGIARESVSPGNEPYGDQLRAAAVDVEQARAEAGLSSDTPYQLPGAGTARPATTRVTPTTPAQTFPVAGPMLPPAGPTTGPTGTAPGAVA